MTPRRTTRPHRASSPRFPRIHHVSRPGRTTSPCCSSLGWASCWPFDARGPRRTYLRRLLRQGEAREPRLNRLRAAGHRLSAAVSSPSDRSSLAERQRTNRSYAEGDASSVGSGWWAQVQGGAGREERAVVAAARSPYEMGAEPGDIGEAQLENVLIGRSFAHRPTAQTRSPPAVILHLERASSNGSPGSYRSMLDLLSQGPPRS
jgi:hypothetical protein